MNTERQKALENIVLELSVLRKINARYREALDYYADKNTYTTLVMTDGEGQESFEINEEGGDIANLALEYAVGQLKKLDDCLHDFKKETK